MVVRRLEAADRMPKPRAVHILEVTTRRPLADQQERHSQVVVDRSRQAGRIPEAINHILQLQVDHKLEVAGVVGHILASAAVRSPGEADRKIHKLEVSLVAERVATGQ